MSANYTDEHLANISEQIKHAEQLSHQDAVNLCHLIAAQNELLKSINHYSKWTADVARFYFALTLLGFAFAFLLFFISKH